MVKETRLWYSQFDYKIVLQIEGKLLCEMFYVVEIAKNK